jgi:ubiquinone/menaquinone biosynthesis C-methylase UbiE
MEQLAGAAGFLALRQEILGLADLTRADRVVDVGAGTGLLTLAAARVASHVSAVDISPAMCAHLERKLAAARICNVDVRLGDAADLSLPAGSVDVVLSNYCLHHLRDADKCRALSEIWRVLRPDGRVVIGDMMFDVGLVSRRDRALIFRFVGTMLRRGPGGVIRLLKNVVRLLTGRGEHPRNVEWWREALDAAGFVDVCVRALSHEGGVAVARRPASAA